MKYAKIKRRKSLSSENDHLYEKLDRSKLPEHVAIIMDGNGRWAKKKLMNRVRGHEQGVKVVREITRACRNIGIPFLTLYAFSTENWQRPKPEVAALMVLLKKFLKSEHDELIKNNIKLNAIGQINRLPSDVREILEQTISDTANNTRLNLNLALSYGGREEITQAVQNIAQKVKNGTLTPEEINENLIKENLYTKNFPDPDLMIRTSGEMRISNFLLWQLAYSEMFITDTLWPDFSQEEFIEILMDYQKRDRRFGKVKEKG